MVVLKNLNGELGLFYYYEVESLVEKGYQEISKIAEPPFRMRITKIKEEDRNFDMIRHMVAERMDRLHEVIETLDFFEKMYGGKK